MTPVKFLGLAAVGLTLSACAELDLAAVPGDKTRDRGINSHHLSTMVAGIWVDPNGCDHWIIDDGLEGYMSERMTPDGRPVCSGVAPPETVVGPFKAGSRVPDPVRPSNYR
ncbi:hypothetical protein EU805_11940 [Salipiger sp. IMCC34102]|uniref:hypothetical protein n=1 Tax=Salipiger sp. IMCC34102 TaxID=2510647 RepID=UPI00101B7EF9|nr:hypothetical protein [Salipiger sp. IMCC34102]RYH01893.1 hypothetical protein EU805_11940 [Salipiger sp. IMCC34102]